MTQSNGNGDSLFGNARTDSTGSMTSTKRSTASVAGRVFREFKWGLLTLFLLMVVVVALVYEGGRRRAATPAWTNLADSAAESAREDGSPPEIGDTVRSSPVRDQAFIVQPELQPEWDAPPSSEGDRRGRPPSDQTPSQKAAGVPASRQPNQKLETNTATGKNVGAAGETYTVKPGDSLTKIARQFYGIEKTAIGVEAILAANSDAVKNANLIHPGMTLKIPVLTDSGPASDAARFDSTPAAEQVGRKGSSQASPAQLSDGSGRLVYVVQSGDCLESIAEKLLKDRKRWREIAEANKISGSRIRAGQKLVVAVNTHLQEHRKTTP